MGNLIEFVKNSENVKRLAEERAERQDYAGAVSVLLSEEKKTKNKLEIYADIAKLYTEMDLYDEAIEYWFRYINIASKRNITEGYNGLGANFYFLENKPMAGFYFNLQLMSGDNEEYDYEDELLDYLDEIVEDKKNSYYVAYPPQPENYSSVVEKGREFVGNKKFSEAISLLLTVPETSEYFADACTELSIAYYFSGDTVKAVDYSKKAVENGADDAFNLCNLISMLVNSGRIEETAPYIKKIENYKDGEPEDYYKIMTAYLELNESEKALAFSEKVISGSPYDVNTYYVRGLIFYNLGKRKDAYENFKKAYLIARSPVALWYLRYTDGVLSGQIKQPYKKLEYIVNLPDDAVNSEIAKLKKYIFETEKQLKRHGRAEIRELTDWAFSTTNRSFQVAAATVAARMKVKDMNDCLAEKLISPVVFDDVKCNIVTALCENGFDKLCGAVYGNIYRKLQFLKLDFSDANGDIFVKAFAFAFGRISVFENEKLYKLRDGAYEIYYSLTGNGNIKKVNNINALAAVMFIYSGLGLLKGNKNIAVFFDCKYENLVEILELLK